MTFSLLSVFFLLSALFVCMTNFLYSIRGKGTIDEWSRSEIQSNFPHAFFVPAYWHWLSDKEKIDENAILIASFFIIYVRKGQTVVCVCACTGMCERNNTKHRKEIAICHKIIFRNMKETEKQFSFRSLFFCVWFVRAVAAVVVRSIQCFYRFARKRFASSFHFFFILKTDTSLGKSTEDIHITYVFRT